MAQHSRDLANKFNHVFDPTTITVEERTDFMHALYHLKHLMRACPHT